MARTLETIAEELRAEALRYPETYEENPWGDRVVKVKGKMFFLCGVHQDKLYATAKLPSSGVMALQLPFAKPTGYGLGKSGWVTAQFEKPSQVPVAMLMEWVEESFRAVAPKMVLKAWEAGAAQPAAKATATKAAKAGKPKPAARPETKPAARVPAGTAVLLIGDDALRLGRAREALEARGFKISGTAAPDEEALGQLASRRSKAVVIDLGRRAPAGLELASALARSQFKDIPVFFAGARDASAERRVRAALPKLAGCSRVPPGDAEFVDLLVAKLARKR